MGKTAIVKAFTSKTFKSQYRPTIGADFQCKELQIEDQVVALQLWDLAGAEKFRSMGFVRLLCNNAYHARG